MVADASLAERGWSYHEASETVGGIGHGPIDAQCAAGAKRLVLRRATARHPDRSSDQRRADPRRAALRLVGDQRSGAVLVRKPADRGLHLRAHRGASVADAKARLLARRTDRRPGQRSDGQVRAARRIRGDGVPVHLCARHLRRRDRADTFAELPGRPEMASVVRADRARRTGHFGDARARTRRRSLHHPLAQLRLDARLTWSRAWAVSSCFISRSSSA